MRTKKKLIKVVTVLARDINTLRLDMVLLKKGLDDLCDSYDNHSHHDNPQCKTKHL